MRRGLALAAHLTPPTYMQDTAAAVATSVTSVTASKPSGSAVKDTLIAFCWANNTSAAWTLDAAFTSVVANTALGSAVASRVVDGSEGSTFGFTRSVGTAAAGVIIVRIAGAWKVYDANIGSAGATLSIDLPSINSEARNTMLLQIATMLTTSAASWTAPGTATLRTNTTSTGSAVQYGVGDELVGPTGSGNGLRTWTHTTSQGTRGAILALTPAA